MLFCQLMINGLASHLRYSTHPCQPPTHYFNVQKASTAGPPSQKPQTKRPLVSTCVCSHFLRLHQTSLLVYVVLVQVKEESVNKLRAWSKWNVTTLRLSVRRSQSAATFSADAASVTFPKELLQHSVLYIYIFKKSTATNSNTAKNRKCIRIFGTKQSK